MSWNKRIAGMVEIVTGLVMGSNGVTTSKASGDDDEIEAETAWHFGFYSRPLDGARGVILKADGQGNTALLIGYRDMQYEFALNKGEVGISNAYEAQIYLTNGGDIEIDSGGTTEGAGDGEIVLNGGTKKVARVDDTAACGTLEMLGGIGSSFGGLKYTAPDGTITTLTAAGVLTLRGKIDSGADKVKA